LADRPKTLPTKAVAGPSNQFYRTGRPLVEGRPFLFVFNAHLDHVGDITDDLDLKSDFLGRNDASRANF
jgi:hypothetical protein